MTRILLLDIDGVLVYPLGYRAALRAAFDRLTGCADCLSETLLASLEARSISSEFDMLPLLVGACWQERLARHPLPDLPTDVLDAAVRIRQAAPDGLCDLSIPPFPISAHLFPAEAAYRAGLFPAIPDRLRRNLLLHSRDVYRSSTTRLFQEFVLGSETFSRTYRLPAQIRTPSYLQRHDRPLLGGSAFARLERARRTNGLHLASITARPSLPPSEILDPDGAYPPEAEQALAQVGLADMPVIGLGRLDYVARRAGLPVEALLKPAPAHALAAILAAQWGQELLAVETAVRSLHAGRFQPPTALPATFEVHVVEDTSAGIRSAQQAVQWLNAWGYVVAFFPWGLSAGNPLKREALQQEGIPCFDAWDDLLEAMGL